MREDMNFSVLSSPQFPNDNKCLNFERLPPLLFSFLLATLIFFLFILYSPSPSLNPLHPEPDFDQNLITNSKDGNQLDCEFSKGEWVPDVEGPQYTNRSCRTIPGSKNCFMQGRKDTNFLHWRWKPQQCELPRFNPAKFLEFFRGKTLAFIGDSVARNHMESLLCLLSTVETPIDEYKDEEDRNRVWYFPRQQFKMMILWTKFLVVGEERVINGSSSSGVWDLHLNKIDPGWSSSIHDVDYVIISDAHWFFRPLHIHNGTTVIGCVYCNEPETEHIDVSVALKMVYRVALDHINKCETCRVKVTMVRTFSPAHFENGTWDNGGRCERRRPSSEGEVAEMKGDMRMREAQVEEVERARRVGAERGRRFGVLDVTRVMAVRGDGHPGRFWGNKWMKGYNDCVHWCLPGPIDVWNDLLMAVLSKEVALVSQ